MLAIDQALKLAHLSDQLGMGTVMGAIGLDQGQQRKHWRRGNRSGQGKHVIGVGRLIRPQQQAEKSALPACVK
ncbi:hypothetical protein DLREEDagrD3_27990 [Denitratisoma sp. agr-D3]